MLGRDWHDLAWQQGGVLGLVAGEQDPLAFLLAQAVGHLAATAFAAIHAFPSPWSWRCGWPPTSRSAKRLTVAAVDRLVHQGHIVGIKGESYRQKAAAAKVSSDAPGPPMSLTRAAWASRSRPATTQPSRGLAATRKLGHQP
ncbi:MAG: ATP-binding protein [Synechococcus lacustris]